MSENQKLFALLIDGDNVSPSLVPQILAKIKEYGDPLVRRVYSSKNSIAAWDDAALKYSIKGIRVPNNTKGKNAADISLVIGAMDLLYNQSDFAGFCIVSSDSDFTELANYIKEKRKFVLGIGDERTLESFANACSEFVCIKNPPQQQAIAPKTPVLQEPIPTELTPKIPEPPVPTPEVKTFKLPPHQVPTHTGVEPKAPPSTEPPTILPSPPKASEAHEAIKPPVSQTSSPKPAVPQDTEFEIPFIRAYDNGIKDKDGWVHLREIREAMKNSDSEFESREYQSGRSFAEKAKTLAKLYPGIIEINEILDSKPVIHYVRIHLAPRPEFERFRKAYKHAFNSQPIKDKDGWVKLSNLGVSLRELYKDNNPLIYRGTHYKQLLQVIQLMKRDYPKAIEIDETFSGHPQIRMKA